MRSVDRVWWAVGAVVILGAAAAMLVATGVVRIPVSSGPITPSLADTTRGSIPTSTLAPASKDEAAAVRADYETYLATITQVRTDGGVNPTRLTHVAAGEQLNTLTREAELWRSKGWKLSGAPTVVTWGKPLAVQVDGVRGMSLDTCEDYTKSYAVDASGTAVRAQDAVVKLATSSVLEKQQNTWVVTHQLLRGVTSCPQS